MKISIRLNLEKIPSGTAQERQYSYNPRLNRVMTYPSKSYKESKKVYKKALLPYAPKSPLKAPVSLDIELYYPTKDKRKIGTLKTTKPDGDNLLKVIKDVMNELNFFDDDSNVSVEKISRMWVSEDESGVFIEVCEI